MIKYNDFQRMWIVLSRNLRELVENGEVLTCSHEQVQFVLAGVEQLAQAQQVRARLAEDRPAYMLLLDAAERAAIAAEKTIMVAVLEHDGVTEAGRIRLGGGEGDKLRTQYGSRAISPTVARQLKAGDFFSVSERTPVDRAWVVYQASADFADGRVDADRISPHRDHPPVSFADANQVVFLITDTDGLLVRIV